MSEDGTSSLFDSTSRKAGAVAARSAGRRNFQILTHLAEHGPSTLFEVAAAIGVFDHQISGRFTLLHQQGVIERTGLRRKKPETGCEADVWRIAEQKPREPELADHLGLPQTLKIEDELWERGIVLDATATPDAPGIPYVRRADAGGCRLSWRVAFVECEGCGRRLKLVEEAGKKTYRCGTPGCNRVWHPILVQEPGQAPVLAMVMKHL